MAQTREMRSLTIVLASPMRSLTIVFASPTHTEKERSTLARLSIYESIWGHWHERNSRKASRKTGINRSVDIYKQQMAKMTRRENHATSQIYVSPSNE